MELSAAEITAVQGSMANINKDVVKNIGAVYAVLFANHKDIQQKFTIFKNVDAAAIATADKFPAFAEDFAKDLTKLTASLANKADYNAWIADSKKRHIPARGVQKEQYGAVLDTIASVTGVDAWKKVGVKVVASMGN